MTDEVDLEGRDLRNWLPLGRDPECEAERDELRAEVVTMRGVIQDLVHLAENEESASEEAWNEAWTNAQLVLGPRKERQNRIALDQDQ